MRLSIQVLERQARSKEESILGHSTSPNFLSLPTLIIVTGWVLILAGAIVLGGALSRRRAGEGFAQIKDFLKPSVRQRQAVVSGGRDRRMLAPYDDDDLADGRIPFPDHYPNHENHEYERYAEPRGVAKPRLPSPTDQPGRREVLGLGAMLLGGATLWGIDRQQAGLSPFPPTGPNDSILNLKEFGAVGDGKADDGPALRSALAALQKQGGGTLYLPAGVYQCSAVPPGSTPRFNFCGRISGNSHIIGAGAGSTVIRLAPNSPNHTWVLTNYHLSQPIDTNITVEHLTIDGNAVHQSMKNDAQDGLVFVRVQGVTVRNVVFKNLYGRTSGGPGPSGTPGENFHTDCKGCSDIIYSDCRVESDPKAPCGTGFSLNGSSRAVYSNCTASGLKFGQGYTHWKSKDVTYLGCHAFDCGSDGFHSEYSDLLTYTACVSGTAWLAHQGSLQHQISTKGCMIGFNVYHGSRVQYSQCTAHGNDTSGLKVEQSSDVSVVGGIFTENDIGIRLQEGRSVAGTILSMHPNLNDNKSGHLWYAGDVTALSGKLSAPAIPASSRTMGNPFPFSVTVYVSGGEVDHIDLNGVNVGKQSGALNLPPRGTINLTYSKAPTWAWVAG